MTRKEIMAGNAAKLEKRKRMRDWLGRYREALEEERQMRLIIRDIEEDATTLHSPRMDGMPGGTTGDAMANYVMRREAAIRDYERKARELEGIRKEVERAIARQDERRASCCAIGTSAAIRGAGSPGRCATPCRGSRASMRRRWTGWRKCRHN